MSDYYLDVVTRCADMPLFAAARRNDPPTSKAAGRASRAFATGHGRRILDALASAPGTKDEIAARCGLDEQQVARRMHELRRRGLVVEVGEAVSPTGNRETRYRRATDGR
jgi:predicted Rossmann fold nucleotide-binding protein DprA/Smf involved in DNA uptake